MSGRLTALFPDSRICLLTSDGGVARTTLTDGGLHEQWLLEGRSSWARTSGSRGGSPLYTQLATVDDYAEVGAIALDSNGRVHVFLDDGERFNIGREDAEYVQLAAGCDTVALLRCNGVVDVCLFYDPVGEETRIKFICAELAEPRAGIVYAQIAMAGRWFSALASDGSCTTAGRYGQRYWPVGCAQMAVSKSHAVVLMVDGSCGADGYNNDGQCNIPFLPGDLTYTEVAAGNRHTVLLRSDGAAVAHGCNRYHQCDVPPLVGDMTYVKLAATPEATVLIRSDGAAAVCGQGYPGVVLNPPCSDVTFMPFALPTLTLQATLEGKTIRFLSFSGAERYRTDAAPGMRLSEIYRRLKCEWRFGRLGRGLGGVDAVLPGGRLLSSVSADETVASSWVLLPMRVHGKRRRIACSRDR